MEGTASIEAIREHDDCNGNIIVTRRVCICDMQINHYRHYVIWHDLDPAAPFSIPVTKKAYSDFELYVRPLFDSLPHNHDMVIARLQSFIALHAPRDQNV